MEPEMAAKQRLNNNNDNHNNNSISYRHKNARENCVARHSTKAKFASNHALVVVHNIRYLFIHFCLHLVSCGFGLFDAFDWLPVFGKCNDAWSHKFCLPILFILSNGWRDERRTNKNNRATILVGRARSLCVCATAAAGYWRLTRCDCVFTR